MPLEIDLPPDTESISLSEFINCIDSAGYEFKENADLIDSAKYLKKLANNKHFLLDLMFEELRGVGEFQGSNFYGPQVFMLHRTDKYFVRANVWKPISQMEKAVPDFQYDICHDHNFDILTVGYLGPGYCSRTYTYDSSAVVGALGEKVDLVPGGLFTLHKGTVALYRAKKDVHIQLPPEELSISLNLIPKNDKTDELQLQFDEETGCIRRYLQSSGSETVVRFAGLLGQESWLELLGRIAATHPSPQMRALALVSQCRIAPELCSSIGPQANDGRAELIANIVRRELEDYGACLRGLEPVRGSEQTCAFGKHA
jgi:hypothetical protein